MSKQETPPKTAQEYVVEAIESVLILDPSQIIPDSDLRRDLGANNLDLIEIVMILEEEVGFETTAEASDNLITVRDLTEYVAQKMVLAHG